MMRKAVVLALLAVSTVLAGCASVDYVSPRGSEAEQAARVIVYRVRSSFQSGPERPYVYIDDQSIGQLGNGSTLTVTVVPGRHEFTVKEPVLFMPAFTSGRVQMELQAGETYYLRYSKHFTGVAVAAGTPVATGSSRFVQATREMYEAEHLSARR